ncbi:MAG: hypothetical protein EXS41_00125 [Opitutaceae bacterium]|nr:hypothetical protein [Opitutaceae bacterium]
MHEDFQELEGELKHLRPRASSSGLVARLEQELAPAVSRSPRRTCSTATIWGPWKWTIWSMVTAAAIAVALIVSRNLGPVGNRIVQSEPGPAVSATQSAEIYKPVRADNMLYDTREENGVTLPDGTFARRVRSRYVDTITWRNSRTNASLRWSIPREEVRVIPVAFQ